MTYYDLSPIELRALTTDPMVGSVSEHLAKARKGESALIDCVIQGRTAWASASELGDKMASQST